MNEVTALTNFTYEGTGVRVLGTKYEPWFVCRDVFAILEIPINYMARTLKRLDDDEKGVIQLMTPGGQQETWIVSEPGLYKIMLRSRTPKAEAFTRFVTHEVLPSIRRFGRYDSRYTYTGERGRPRLSQSEKNRREGERLQQKHEKMHEAFEKEQKYELANGQKCTFEDLQFYCNLLDAPSDYLKGNQASVMIDYINREMESREITDTKHIYPTNKCVADDVEDETYTIVVDGKVIELVK